MTGSWSIQAPNGGFVPCRLADVAGDTAIFSTLPCKFTGTPIHYFVLLRPAPSRVTVGALGFLQARVDILAGL
jgi:hypothetical protein